MKVVKSRFKFWTGAVKQYTEVVNLKFKIYFFAWNLKVVKSRFKFWTGLVKQYTEVVNLKFKIARLIAYKAVVYKIFGSEIENSNEGV